MQLGATLTSKGQLTIPKQVRDALDLRAGDRVYFTVHEAAALISKIPDFLDLAGSVPVPTEARGKTWKEIREETRRRAAGEKAERSKRS
jgi:AbrB family looped-hinge helix DNA binding protein